MQQIFTVALPLLAAVTTSTVTLPSVFPPPPVNGPPPFAIIQEEPTSKTETKEVAPERPKEKRIICKAMVTLAISNVFTLSMNNLLPLKSQIPMMYCDLYR